MGSWISAPSEVDLNPSWPSSTPLPTLSRSPAHHFARRSRIAPHPWAATLWGGQVFDAISVDTFKFKGPAQEGSCCSAQPAAAAASSKDRLP